ncbi:uncharacterized protein LOC118814929 isoform X2 [Colossoma macropomum]|uniref:uncharacterized protein LOC118814929 isoform X2 n=1 Tax=Colossoma macropomum TaxID=42526 RepID=UPI0018642D82|nr:uncharacterized protein LOC118814929 isoform X2 [Colossoma macropomum]
MNVYEEAPSGSRVESECVKMEDECVKTDDEGVKTEDVCQTLQSTPPVENPNPTHKPVRSCRIKTKLLLFNTLLLIVILIMIGLFIAKKPQAPAAENQQNTEVSRTEDAGVDDESGSGELWILHDGMFYLFWEDEGSCAEAEKFCKERNSRIGTVTNKNEDWILSQANGRKLWVNMDGDTAGPLNKTLGQCPQDEGNSANSEDVQGWVCESGQLKSLQIPESPNRTPPSFSFYDSFIFDDYEEAADYSITDYEEYSLEYAPSENPTAAPEHESSASSAASLLSVKIYIITVSVLASLRPLHF